MSEFNFKNLDNSTRWHMSAEKEFDEKNNTIYVSKRLNDQGKNFFKQILGTCFIHYDNTWLANELRESKFWNAVEQRQHPTQGLIEAKVPMNAPDVLADTEFNKYYMRAVCIKALQAGINDVTIYRAKETSRPRPEHEELVGKSVNAEQLLEQLRHGESELASPNCGLSICI